MEKIKQLIEDGMSISRIAVLYSLPKNQIKNIVTENNFKIKHEHFTDDKIEHICELYNSGISAKQLGVKYKIDKRRIQKWAKEKQTLRNKNDSHRFTFFNDHIFDIINDPAKAYWLGFFYADSYNSSDINTVAINLAGTEEKYLHKLAIFFGLDINKVIRGINNQGNDVASLKLYSKHLCDTLTNLGCPKAKSFIIQYPNWLNDNLHSHFLRGMFDGDGCLKQNLSEWNFSIVSTENCCKDISKLINDKLNINIPYHNISDTGNNTCILEKSGNQSIYSVLSWLYSGSNSDIRLERKYEKFKQLEYQQIEKNKNISLQGGDCIKINNIELTAEYLRTISKIQKEQLVEPVFNVFRDIGWLYPKKTDDKLKTEYKRLCDAKADLSILELNNNNRLGTDICKHFCETFYRTGNPNMLEIWNDDNKLKEVIRNRLVINWTSKTNEVFNITYRMMLQGMRSMAMVSQTSVFKPSIAKFICEKYSQEGDVVGDFSAGFGGRLLGAMSCNRKYIGTDPLTIPELEKMVEFFGFKDVTLYNIGSEYYKGIENSVDLYWSSPPYFSKEKYSKDKSQSYNMGEQYFYEEYWKKTLENVKYMLKPNKWFGLNIYNVPKMLEMAKVYFGEQIEEIKLKTRRNHLTKAAGDIKFESVFMFKNIK